jgi:signal recognition particle subunit SRP54
MLETVAQGFRTAKNRLQGFRELNESNIEDALKDIRESLLEADVEFHVAKRFLEGVKEQALGELVATRVGHDGEKLSATPGEHFIKICHDALEALMGPADTDLTYASTGITKIMMVGLQGSGKTTTAGKLAHLLGSEKDRKVCLVAADIYRPAAVEQLKVLGERLGIPVYHRPDTSPDDMCAAAIPFARQEGCDTLIFDTAGRLAIDAPLMEELERIQSRTQPDNILFVCDAMIGQDAVRTANEFHRRLAFDGVVLTKMDGDARGGAALSIKEVTGRPIKFLGMGEGLDKLEEFRPEGLADRILGFGDIVGLVKDFEGVVDEKKAEEDAKKLLSGDFDMNTFLEQIKTIQKMGSLKDLMAKMPGMSDAIPEGANIDDSELVKIEAMISSMTHSERGDPALIDSSRSDRIGRGSGRAASEVQSLVTRFDGMRQMMGQIGKSPGLLGRLPGMRQLGQLKAMKGMAGMGDLFGDMSGGMGGGGMSKSALLRQAKQLRQAGQPLPKELQEALAAAGVGSGGRNAMTAMVDPSLKKERRKKAKQARAQRKKSRRRK